MPPRIQLPFRPSTIQSSGSSYQPLAPFLYPCLRQPQQKRNVSILNQLSDTRGAYNKKIRRGRGPSSGKGKTAGRGHKGQKQHGKASLHQSSEGVDASNLSFRYLLGSMEAKRQTKLSPVKGASRICEIRHLDPYR